MELVNELAKAPGDPAARFAAETAVSLIQPYAPHVAEELWARARARAAVGAAVAGRRRGACSSATRSSSSLQVNGKVRDRLEVPARAARGRAGRARAGVERVQAHLDGGESARRSSCRTSSSTSSSERAGPRPGGFPLHQRMPVSIERSTCASVLRRRGRDPARLRRRCRGARARPARFLRRARPVAALRVGPGAHRDAGAAEDEHDLRGRPVAGLAASTDRLVGPRRTVPCSPSRPPRPRGTVAPYAATATRRHESNATPSVCTPGTDVGSARITIVTMDARNDGDLVAAARRGSREAAAALFARHWPGGLARGLWDHGPPRDGRRRRAGRVRARVRARRGSTAPAVRAVAHRIVVNRAARPAARGTAARRRELLEELAVRRRAEAGDQACWRRSRGCRCNAGPSSCCATASAGPAAIAETLDLRSVRSIRASPAHSTSYGRSSR